MNVTEMTFTILLLLSPLPGCDTSHLPQADADDAGDADTDSPAPNIPIVINEINARSPDWFELINDSDETLSLSGLSLTDQNDNGDVNQDHLTPLPPSLSLEAGETLVVIANPDVPLEGIVTGDACVFDGVDRCLHVDFGLNNSDGDGLFVVTSDGQIVAAADYPSNAADDGNSWCRIPDAQGDFRQCAPTPSTTNQISETQ